MLKEKAEYKLAAYTKVANLNTLVSDFLVALNKSVLTNAEVSGIMSFIGTVQVFQTTLTVAEVALSQAAENLEKQHKDGAKTL